MGIRVFRVRLAVLTGLAALAACARPDCPQGDIVLGDVSVVDVASGTLIAGRDVAIANGVITAVVPAAGVSCPVAARRIDLDGAYLSPALFDLHVHIFDQRDLQLYALMGVQGVRNLDGWDWHLALREKSAATPWLAQLFTSGRQYQAPLTDSPDQIRKGFAEDSAAGYDWVKLYDGLDQELFDAVVHAPRGAMRVTGHLPSGVPLPDVLRSGIYDDIAHAEELYFAMRSQDAEWDVLLDQVAEQMIASGTSLTSALVTNKMILEQMSDFAANIARDEVSYAAPLLQMFWASDFNPNKGAGHGSVERMSGNLDGMMAMVAALAERGVTILAGTDAPNPTSVPAFSLYDELELLTAAGLSPAQAIRAATSDAAAHLGLAPGTGQVAVGAPANFIVTSKNPLYGVSALRDISALVSDGEYRTREELDGQLAMLRAEYAKDLEYLALFSPAGPEAIFDAIEADGSAGTISKEGLQSLVWIYKKFGNDDAATQVARELEMRYPDSEIEVGQQER